MKRILVGLGLLFCAWFLAACSSPTRPPATGPVILISIDGFRWDYLQLHNAPTLKALAAGGVHATRLTPSFPSKTFPNHYTLVTGLYPQNHGIVANWFYDPADNAKFDMGKTEARWWQGGEPIWITAEKQGVRSACFFWPGSESENHGIRPTFSKPFNHQLPSADRVDGLLAWLSLPAAQRPRFATLYFDIVDTQGHAHGPLAPETGAAVQEVDAAVARLLAGLERLGLRETANLVIVSDHGIVGPVEDTSRRAIAGGTQGNMFVRTRSVMLVKEAGAVGTLRTSEDFMPNAEMPRIVCEDIGGCVNPYLDNRVIAAHGRDDPYQVSLVPWQFSLQEPDAFVIRSQLTLRGKDPFSAGNWSGIE